jgi:hypothetical protein
VQVQLGHYSRSKKARLANSRTHQVLSRQTRQAAKSRATKSSLEAVFEPIAAAIENERNRLAQVQSILVCVNTTMENIDEDADDVPYYPTLIAMACKLIREAAHRLDSVHRRPFLDELVKMAKG